MKSQWLGLAAGLILTALPLIGCGQAPATTAEIKPATVEHLDGAEPTRVTLTEEAAKRLDIQTAAVRDTTIKGTPRKTIPYAAIIYDTNGDTWAYTNPQPLVYFRHRITVDSIGGDTAALSDGPSSGMAVVTVGAEELYGAETEFAEE